MNIICCAVSAMYKIIICRSNQVWGTDITYIRLLHGFLYLVAIIDWFSRYVLSFRISMDGKGRALDNVFTERLWRSVKYEEVYLNEYRTPLEAHQRIKQYFHFYNHQRPHQSLNYLTPAEVYFSTLSSNIFIPSKIV